MTDLLLSPAQRRALRLLDARDRELGTVGWSGVISEGSATCVMDGQPWIHWRTAISLWRRGLIDIENWDRADGLDLEEQPETDGGLRLTEAGRRALEET